MTYLNGGCERDVPEEMGGMWWRGVCDLFKDPKGDTQFLGAYHSFAGIQESQLRETTGTSGRLGMFDCITLVKCSGYPSTSFSQ